MSIRLVLYPRVGTQKPNTKKLLKTNLKTVAK